LAGKLRASELPNVLVRRHLTSSTRLEYSLAHKFHRDAVTPNQDFLICEHPSSKSLYIAGGGSFHSWKFLPNIGQYVVRMLHNKLDEKEKKRWGWNRSNNGGACKMYSPVRDLKDIESYDGSSNIAIGGNYVAIL
jgi:sarcosine oxidase/L-pipecolate oxidase